MTQTAKKNVVKLVRDTRPVDLVYRLEGIAHDVSVIHWACYGLADVGSDDIKGVERLAMRIQQDIEELAAEVQP
ncbi:MAG: hypothetical protein ACLQF1_18555 [Methyloceanibacter sp.]|jgi:hypothetical protein